jgi:hypothetical protein
MEKTIKQLELMLKVRQEQCEIVKLLGAGVVLVEMI